MKFDEIVLFLNNNTRHFSAPYGVLPSEGRSFKGTKYKSVTFGVARYLDATIKYFNHKFILVEARGPLEYKLESKYYSVESLMKDLESYLI